MKKTILFLFAVSFFCNTAYSQNSDSLYSFTSYLGAGYVYNISSFEYEFGSLNRGGLQANLRVMWKPEHLLSGGFEFGYTDVYSIDNDNFPIDSGFTSVSTNLYAYQFMVIFMMPIIENWEVNIGTGAAFSTTKTNAFGLESISTFIASTSIISTGYYWSVMKDSRLGGELRFTALPKYGDYTVSLLVSFAYKFLEY